VETCILIASGSRASIYQAKKADLSGMELVESFDHSINHEMNRDMLTDRPGHFATGSGARGDYEKADPKEAEKDKFALELARKIKEVLYGKKFKRLIIVSAPHFHGLFNEHLNKHHLDIEAGNILHIEKDYTAFKPADLLKQLQKLIYEKA
jgi:protein required for attachment to host cells